MKRAFVDFEFLISIMDALADPVFVKDTQHKWVALNEAFCRFMGHAREDLLGRSDFDFFPDEEARVFWEKDDMVLSTGQENVNVERFTGADGVTRIISTKKTRMEVGDAHFLVGVIRDITDMKRVESDLREARDAADAANRAKSQFLANMSHDLRTPMYGVLGFTDLLKETDLDPIQRQYLRLVDQSANSLLGLLNDVLDFSKIEAGELVLERGRFRLDDLLGASLHTQAVPAGDKGLELAYRLPPDLADLAVEGDRLRLRQVIDNLVGNAIKFTAEGHVNVDVSVVSRTDAEIELRVEVEDTGIGIPEERQAEIFDAFKQLETRANSRGVGLGLAIASRLVERMGGQIGLQSAPGRGSTFWFTVRLGVVGEAPRSSASRLALRGRRVLVVDDYPLNQRILTEIVESWGMVPAAVGSGPAALDELQRAARAGEPYDLVLLDQVMPGMEGLQVAERIRADDVLGDSAIVLLSSATVGLADPGRLLALRISRTLPKPVTQLDLWTAVAEALGAPAEVAPPEGRPGVVSTRRVLLAEDSAVNQALVSRLMEKRGHHVTLARTGREAVEAFEPGRFDVVLMDVQMPELDGFDATRAIREAERASGTHVPIVAMTAHAMKGDREKCLEAGMDGYLSKPARAEELYAAVEGAGVKR